jgi:hypothetical protein
MSANPDDPLRDDGKEALNSKLNVQYDLSADPRITGTAVVDYSKCQIVCMGGRTTGLLGHKQQRRGVASNLYFVKLRHKDPSFGCLLREMHVIGRDAYAAIISATSYAADVLNKENPNSLTKEPTDLYKWEDFIVTSVVLEYEGVVI